MPSRRRTRAPWEARRLGRNDEAATLFRQILQRRRDHLGALRGLRDLAAQAGRWREALDTQQRVLGFSGGAVSGGIQLVSKAVTAGFSARRPWDSTARRTR